jgi:integrase
MQRTLKAALNIAWKENLIEVNVVTRTTPPKLRHKEVDALTREEVGKFLEGSAKDPLHALFKFAIATGVRVGEASGLTWDCVDIGSKVAQINKQLQRIDSKMTLKDVKSRSSRRPGIGEAN